MSLMVADKSFRFDNAALTPEFWASVHVFYAAYPNVEITEYIFHMAVCTALNPEIWGPAVQTAELTVNEIYSIAYSDVEPDYILLSRIDQDTLGFEKGIRLLFMAVYSAFLQIYTQQPNFWNGTEVTDVTVIPNLLSCVVSYRDGQTDHSSNGFSNPLF